MENAIEESILKVAEKLFLERGFALTTTTEIARQVVCNQALIHYYFRTKELLFQRIFTHKIESLASIFFAIDKSEQPFFDRLSSKIEAHFDLLAANPKLPFLIINELTTNPARMESLKKGIGSFPQTMIRAVEDDLQCEFERGTIRKISAIDLLINIISLNAGVFVMLPILRNGMNLDEEAQRMMIKNRRKEVVEIIINGIKL